MVILANMKIKIIANIFFKQQFLTLLQTDQLNVSIKMGKIMGLLSLKTMGRQPSVLAEIVSEYQSILLAMVS